MAQQANLSFYLGEDITITDQPAGTPVNITGWSIQFTLRQQPSLDSAPLVTKTVGSGVTITNASAGIFTVQLAAADTAGLAEGTYYYYIQRTDSGSATVLTAGQIEFAFRG